IGDYAVPCTRDDTGDVQATVNVEVCLLDSRINYAGGNYLEEIQLPMCEDRECGPDGIGGVCGECAEGATCEEGRCVEPPGVDCTTLRNSYGDGVDQIVCSSNDAAGYGWVLTGRLLWRWGVGPEGNGNNGIRGVDGTPPTCNQDNIGGVAQAGAYFTTRLYSPQTQIRRNGDPLTSCDILYGVVEIECRRMADLQLEALISITDRPSVCLDR
ncbi:MAG: hypothetical protein AAFV29_24475, partial [Myxococcota bacterium]